MAVTVTITTVIPFSGWPGAIRMGPWSFAYWANQTLPLQGFVNPLRHYNGSDDSLVRHMATDHYISILGCVLVSAACCNLKDVPQVTPSLFVQELKWVLKALRQTWATLPCESPLVPVRSSNRSSEWPPSPLFISPWSLHDQLTNTSQQPCSCASNLCSNWMTANPRKLWLLQCRSFGGSHVGVKVETF